MIYYTNVGGTAGLTRPSKFRFLRSFDGRFCFFTGKIVNNLLYIRRQK